MFVETLANRLQCGDEGSFAVLLIANVLHSNLNVNFVLVEQR